MKTNPSRGKNRQAHFYESRNPIIKYYVNARIKAILNEIDSRKDVLEVGHGEGYSTALIAKKAKSVVAFDIHKPAQEIAIQHVRNVGVEKKVTFFLHDVTNPNFPFEQKFDVIICSEILEHLETPIEVLRTLIPLLNKNGRFIITVPNETILWLGRKILFPFKSHELEDVAAHKTKLDKKTFDNIANILDLQITKFMRIPIPILNLNEFYVMEKG